MTDRPTSVTLRFLAAPMDANHWGYVGAGKMLEWIDKAGYACAVGYTGAYCVTAYVGNVRVEKTVKVGALVEVKARVVFTGRTSLQVVCTLSSGDPLTGEREVNTQCLLIFVATDAEGKPTPVPPFEPKSDWELAEYERAKVLTGVRTEVEKAMAEQTYSDATEACHETLRFLAAPTDVNWGGKVHGGYVMHWIMTAGKIVAERWHHGHARSTYAGGYRFYRPMFIGDLVEVDARLIYTHGSEMHVSVWVRSGDARGDHLQATTHCTIVYSAKDADDKDQEVRPWIPRLPEDRALQQHAIDLVKIRSVLGREAPHTAPEGQ